MRTFVLSSSSCVMKMRGSVLRLASVPISSMIIFKYLRLTSMTASYKSFSIKPLKYRSNKPDAQWYRTTNYQPLMMLATVVVCQVNKKLIQEHNSGWCITRSLLKCQPQISDIIHMAATSYATTPLLSGALEKVLQVKMNNIGSQRKLFYILSAVTHWVGHSFSDWTSSSSFLVIVIVIPSWFWLAIPACSIVTFTTIPSNLITVRGQSSGKLCFSFALEPSQGTNWLLQDPILSVTKHSQVISIALEGILVLSTC